MPHLSLPIPDRRNIKVRTLMGATLLRSGDRTSFGSALRTRRRAEPDAVVKITGHARSLSKLHRLEVRE